MGSHTDSCSLPCFLSACSPAKCCSAIFKGGESRWMFCLLSSVPWRHFWMWSKSIQLRFVMEGPSCAVFWVAHMKARCFAFEQSFLSVVFLSLTFPNSTILFPRLEHWACETIVDMCRSRCTCGSWMKNTSSSAHFTAGPLELWPTSRPSCPTSWKNTPKLPRGIQAVDNQRSLSNSLIEQWLVYENLHLEVLQVWACASTFHACIHSWLWLLTRSWYWLKRTPRRWEFQWFIMFCVEN